jgi:uncharacterized DUF497 family protein
MLAIWDDWNEEHIKKHGVATAEADYVLAQMRPPFPQSVGEGKQLVRGQTDRGRYIQVIYVPWSADRIDISALEPYQRLMLAEGHEAVYVIHARELTDREKRSLRRRLR